MAKKSAGLLLYRIEKKILEVFLVHPGGPFWVKKDDGAWSIPKGEFEDDEDPLVAAKRELEEETGFTVSGKFIELTPVKQKGGKIIYAWAVETNIDASLIKKSNLFEIEWPPRSGIKKSLPEIDRATWLKITEAKIKINTGQLPMIEELENKTNS